MARIIISGGHYDNPQTPQIEDSGTTYGTFTEFQICQNIRNEVLRLYPSAIPVPNNLTLKDKIAWINSFCGKDDLCIEIHLNSSQNANLSGTEAYYYDTPYLANIFSRTVSKILGIPNRGAKNDNDSYYRRLGWIRDVKAQSVLVEVCYLSSPYDRIKITIPSGQTKVAQGIVDGINEHLGNLNTLDKLKNIINNLLKYYGKL